ncbi:MAG: 50S ribosomal protein L25 [Alphaproteobacteria bacterium]|nr:50S ribosomal protein L25 [Alphaproteobacteria bacterium]
MKTIHIQGHLRTEFGKKGAKSIRSQSNVPGVIYGGKSEITFFTSVKELKPLVYTSEFQLVEIEIDSNKYRCIVKDLQFHKVTDSLIHIDLLELVDDKKIKATLPLKYVGAAAGVKAGGKLVIKIKAVDVKTFPKYLKEHIEIDISKLELNQNIRVEDIKEEHFEILNSPRIPLVSVTLTRQLKQEEAAAASTSASAATPAKAATPAAAKAEPKKEAKK